MDLEKIVKTLWLKKKITNKWVLDQIQTERSLIEIIIRQQLQYFGHVRRANNDLEKEMMENEKQDSNN